MKPAFEIKEVIPRIFLFEFKINYDMCMHFMRYQEYYESPSPKFRGKVFDLWEFMRWYSLKQPEKMFTYPDDWDGFNLPSYIIPEVWGKGILTRTIYDHEMFQGWKKCNEKANGEKFYIIGAVNRKGALSHEISHGLFYLYPDYKREMTKLVNALSPEIKKEMKGILKTLGYTPKVYTDEIVAYFATGLTESFPDPHAWPEERKVFAKFYRKFVKGLK